MQLTKGLDVLIYYEHVVRELDACMLLRYRLEELGLTVAIASVHRNRYFSFLKYKPKIVVVPFLFSDRNDIVYQEFRECYGNVLCLNLHHEQFYNEMTKVLFMPKNDDSRNAYHLAWNERFAEDLFCNRVDKNKILIAGNPRTDNYYYSNSGWIRTKKRGYKEIIFIPTSFSWAFVDENYFIKNAKIDPVEFRRKKKITMDTVEAFLMSIRKLAYKYPDKLFIVRPHPFEQISTYEQYLKNFIERPVENNIKVVREGNVYEWIKECDLTIGWLTTVSMEASMFGKKNLIYTPIELDDSMQLDFMKLYDHIITQYDELEYIVRNIKSYNPNNSKLQEYIKNSFGNIDGFVNIRIATYISGILNKNQLQQKCHVNELLYNLCRALIIDTGKNILLKLHLLSKVTPFYKGLIEDMLSYNYLEKCYSQYRHNLKDK
jgi:surface carbohydrate biosynthesis protein